VLTPLLIIASVTGALTACILACFQDRNAVGWFIAGAMFPVVSLLLMLIEPRAGLRTVLAGACVALCGLSLWLALRLSNANEQVEVLYASHVRRIHFCSDWRSDISLLQYQLQFHEPQHLGDDFGERVANVFRRNVLRVCGVEESDVHETFSDARLCWRRTQKPECYRDAVSALDARVRKRGI
jgi:hypothetical protein